MSATACTLSKAPPGESGCVRARSRRCRRRDGVLLRQRLHDDAGWIAQRCQFGVGQIDIDLFVLNAENLDLADVGHAQQFVADALGLVLSCGSKPFAVGA